MPQTFLSDYVYDFALLTSGRPRSCTMASATGIPEERSNSGRGEEEPLLGGPGDASQQEDQGLQFNFVIGNEAPIPSFPTSSSMLTSRQAQQ